MKKIISLLVLSALTLPSFALSADEGKSRIKIGPVKVKINNAKDDQRATISRAGDNLIVGAAFVKAVIKGLSSRSTTVSFAITFDSIEGELEAGQTYELSHSDPTALNTVVQAIKVNRRGGRGVSTLDPSVMGDSIPVATGKMKVKSYNPDTQEIKANLVITVKPIGVTKGTKTKLSQKGTKIKMQINSTVE